MTLIVYFLIHQIIIKSKKNKTLINLFNTIDNKFTEFENYAYYNEVKDKIEVLTEKTKISIKNNFKNEKIVVIQQILKLIVLILMLLQYLMIILKKLQ